jgi:hypothetical protein
MPKLVYWNVEHFSEDKFFVRKRKRKFDDDEAWGENHAVPLRNLLVRTVTWHDPDFIVILEVQPGANGLASGTVVQDSGSWGILQSIRDHNHPQWALVPPLVLGQNDKAEGIAVFYRSDRYYFTGPWRYPGGGGPAGSPMAIGAPGFYGAPWKKTGLGARTNALPMRTLPHNAPVNAGIREDKLAGQWRFRHTTPLGAWLQFPGPGPDFRTPFLTTFWNATANTRLKLVAFHAPPALGQSADGTRRLSYMDPIQVIAAGETQVIVGDFNVSIFNGPAVAWAYGPLATLGYGRLINPTADVFPAKGYVCTHIKSVGPSSSDGGAAPWSTNGYPGFGYQSTSGRYGRYDSIDNAFRRYPVGTAPPLSKITIINRVTGSPYDEVAPAPGPVGVYGYVTWLDHPESLNSPQGINEHSLTAYDHLEQFKSLDDYALIRQCSDHLPLIFDF